MFKVLLIEDKDDDAYVVQELIHSNLPNADCIRARTMQEAEVILADQEDALNIVLIGVTPQEGAMADEASMKINQWAEKMPIIVLTEENDEHHLARGFVHQGAEDCLSKDIITSDPQHIRRAIGIAIQRHQLYKKLNNDRKDLQDELRQKEAVLNCFLGGYSIENSAEKRPPE